MSEWISTKDRFPEEFENVLIWCEGINVMGAHLFYERRKNYKSPLMWFIHNCYESESSIMWNEVTHWMPLPEPPKE